MQFKIPQDVQRADKIVGPLTLRQLVIVCVGGGIAYSLYTVLARQYFVEVWIIPVIFISLITVAFAFFTFHDIHFEKLILIFIEYKIKPRRRTWQQMRGDTLISVLQNRPQKLVQAVQKKEELDIERRKKLHDITTLVDTHGKKLIDR